MPETRITSSNEQARYFPYSGAFFAERATFWEAGQDSFTKPPAQNPDMFQKLQNVEPVLQGVLNRRRGYSLYNSQTSFVYQQGYSFRSEILNAKDVVFTSPENIQVFTEAGVSLIASLFTPTSGALKPRMVNSRSYGYFADGNTADNKKWNGGTGAGNVTNWGLAVGSSGPTIWGPNGPGNATDVNTASTPWSNVNNILVQDGNYTSVFVPGASGSYFVPGFGTFSYSYPTSSDQLVMKGFGFSVPTTDTIVGIKVELNISSTSGYYSQATAQLIYNSAAYGATRTTTVGTTQGFVTFGGPTDLWGINLTPTQANTANFGVQFFVSGLQSTFKADFIRITIYTGTGAIVIGSPSGSGPITLVSPTGRVYFYVFQNSVDGTVSGLSSPSLGTGPLTNIATIPLSNIPTCSDTQCDTVIILATADGGDETTLYFVGTVPNGTSTFSDTTPDSIPVGSTYTGPALLTNPLYQDTDANGFLHGVANNNPPPAILYPTLHKGRIYGLIGSVLYYSKNLDDVTTATGTITSKWEEAWPATNQIDFSSGLAETGKGLLSDGETLWIATERGIRRLVGDSPSNFQIPEIQFNETGLTNQDTWKVVFAQGQPVGSMWLTPDNRVILSDFNTYDDVGETIQDVLNSINPNALLPPHACFVSQGPAEYFMLYIPTGMSHDPDTICVFNTKTKKWFIWNPTDHVTASLFFYNSIGTPIWAIASNTGPLYSWDTSGTNFLDRANSNPAPFAVQAQTSWLDLGDSTIRKALNQMLLATLDSSVTVQIEAAVTAIDLQSAPVTVLPQSNLANGPLNDLLVPLAGANTNHRWYRITFNSAGGFNQNFLSWFSIEAVPLFRY